MQRQLMSSDEMNHPLVTW